MAENIPSFMDDNKGMRVPETIKVNLDGNMQNFGENRPAFKGDEMKVPDRIVLSGSGQSETQVSRNIGLENVGVNLDNYMGGMVTPPRTLTVDDATSRYVERRTNDENDKHNRSSHKGPEHVDNSDFKLQSEIVRLNKRVEWLEKKVAEKQSNGFWKTTFFCFLTVVNPIIIHWLLTSRRH